MDEHRTRQTNAESTNKMLLVVIFNLVGVGSLIVMMILSVEQSPYPDGVGVVLALLIGIPMLLICAGLPAYNWWHGRQSRSHGDGGALS